MKDRMHAQESVAIQGNTAGEEVQRRPMSIIGEMAARERKKTDTIAMYTPTLLGQHYRS